MMGNVSDNLVKKNYQKALTLNIRYVRIHNNQGNLIT